MNSLRFLAAALLFATSIISCNKEDDDDDNTTPPPAATSKTWKLGATTYTVNNYAKVNETFQAYDMSGNGVHFEFGTYPTSSGTYNVVSHTATLGANDVTVLAFGSSSGNSYFATGNDNVKATVTVVSGSTLRVSLPDTWVLKPGADSLKLSADLGDL